MILLTFTTFVAICSLVVPAGYINYRHEVRSHQKAASVIKEDPSLKTKGINLPGYNH